MQIDYSQEFYNFSNSSAGKDPFKIPPEIMMTGNLTELRAYLNTKKNSRGFTNETATYLKGLIEANSYIQRLEKNKESNKSELPELEKRNDGVVMLKGIDMPRNQSSGNGCWSASLELLLQSRGVKIPQEMIRAFRGDRGDLKKEKYSPESGIVKEYNGDSETSIGLRAADLLTRTLPNTGMRQRTYATEPYNNLGRKDLTNVAELESLLIKDIKGAIEEKKSPVSLLVGGHYITVIGIDPEKKELLFKDSLAAEEGNKTYSCSVGNVIMKARSGTGPNAGKIAISWLEDIDPKKKNELYDDNGKIKNQQKYGDLNEGKEEKYIQTGADETTKLYQNTNENYNNMHFGIQEELFLPAELTLEPKEYKPLEPPEVLHAVGKTRAKGVNFIDGTEVVVQPKIEEKEAEIKQKVKETENEQKAQTTEAQPKDEVKPETKTESEVKDPKAEEPEKTENKPKAKERSEEEKQKLEEEKKRQNEAEEKKKEEERRREEEESFARPTLLDYISHLITYILTGKGNEKVERWREHSADMTRRDLAREKTQYLRRKEEEKRKKEDDIEDSIGEKKAEGPDLKSYQTGVTEESAAKVDNQLTDIQQKEMNESKSVGEIERDKNKDGSQTEDEKKEEKKKEQEEELNSLFDKLKATNKDEELPKQVRDNIIKLQEDAIEAREAIRKAAKEAGENGEIKFGENLAKVVAYESLKHDIMNDDTTGWMRTSLKNENFSKNWQSIVLTNGKIHLYSEGEFKKEKADELLSKKGIEQLVMEVDETVESYLAKRKTHEHLFGKGKEVEQNAKEKKQKVEVSLKENLYKQAKKETTQSNLNKGKPKALTEDELRIEKLSSAILK